MKNPYADYTGLRLERPAPRVLQIVFDKPGKMNALDRNAHGELTRIWRDIDADPETSCVVLSGAGGVFSAGGDLQWVEDISVDYRTRIEAFNEARHLVYNIINFSKPIISAVEGTAVGGALAAAILSDISIVGRSTKLIDGHTRLGVAAGDHAAIIWPILCGMAKAKYYLLTCKTIMGEEAERIGLVSLCVDDDKVLAEAIKVASQLASGPPSSIRWTKYVLNSWLRQAGPIFDASVALEFLGMDGPELKEGVAAIRAKRKPSFDPNGPA